MHDFTRRAAGAAGGALIAMGVALGLASLWARPQQPPSQPASAAVLTETFVRIAVAADPFPLRTWRNEVRMLVIGEQADELRPLVERAIATGRLANQCSKTPPRASSAAWRR